MKMTRIAMKKETRINNLQELRLELLMLKAQAREQEAYLDTQYQLIKEKVDRPFRFVNNLISWIPGVDVAKELMGSGAEKGKGDWVSRIFSAGSTAVLNRILLRNTGFIKRILLTALTQQTAGLMNQDRASSLIKQVTDWVRTVDFTKDKKKKVVGAALATTPEPTVKAPDFGIPPDSETY